MIITIIGKKRMQFIRRAFRADSIGRKE